MRRVVASALAIAAVAIAAGEGCSVGNGTGSVSGDLFVTDCWSGKFDLQPDFFGATPSADDDTLTLRIQNGSDYITFSDGISILVTKVTELREAIEANGPQSLTVSLPPAVVPPGVPVTPDPNPSTVEFAAYLQHTCRPETPALYAMSTVTTDGAGEDGGSLCSAQTAAIAGQCNQNVTVPTGGSTITFQHIFDASLANGGDPGSLTAEQRLIQATFDVLLADPRDMCPGGLGPPAPCRGHLTGSFQFYFERGKPAQAFP